MNNIKILVNKFVFGIPGQVPSLELVNKYKLNSMVFLKRVREQEARSIGRLETIKKWARVGEYDKNLVSEVLNK